VGMQQNSAHIERILNEKLMFVGLQSIFLNNGLKSEIK